MAPKKKSVLGFVIEREAIGLTDEQLWRLLRYRDPATGGSAEINEHELARLVELWRERHLLAPKRKAKLWKAGLPALWKKLGLPSRGRRGPERLRALGATPQERRERADYLRVLYQGVVELLRDGGDEVELRRELVEAGVVPADVARQVAAGLHSSPERPGRGAKRRTIASRARGVVLAFLNAKGVTGLTDDFLRRNILRGKIPPKES